MSNRGGYYRGVWELVESDVFMGFLTEDETQVEQSSYLAVGTALSVTIMCGTASGAH